MSHLSIADAKDQFAQLVTQAEAGQAVCITRRGKRVTVLINDAEYDPLAAPRDGAHAFTKRMSAHERACVRMCAHAPKAEIDPFSDAE